MADARRERIAVAIQAALVAGCAPVAVERNRRTAVDADEAPKVVMFDLGHQANTENVGLINYSMRVDVEGTVTTADDAALGTAVSALYVQILASLADYTLGGICSDLRETELVVIVISEDESSKPLATFTVSFEVDFQTPDGDPTG